MGPAQELFLLEVSIQMEEIPGPLQRIQQLHYSCKIEAVEASEDLVTNNHLTDGLISYIYTHFK